MVIFNASFAPISHSKKYLHVLSVNCLEDGATYDITLEKKYFAETLQEKGELHTKP